MHVAIEMTGYGPPDVLKPVDRESKAPAAGEVVVRVHVAGVNRADCFIRAGSWEQAGGWPYVPGLEACGVVEDVGSNVTGFSPGDRVITMMQRMGGIHGERPGGYQEKICVPASTLARVPMEVDLETAGALGLPAVTAWLALQALEVQPGMRVLVTGGSSAVGTMALQLIRERDAIPVATGRTKSKFELMRRSGATDIIDTSRAGWDTRLRGGVDRVFDLVGRVVFGEAVGVLKPGGRLVFVGGTSGGELQFSGWDLMRPVTLTGYSSETLTGGVLQGAIDELSERAVAGSLEVAALNRFYLREAAAAHRAMEGGELSGRVVLVTD